MNTKTCSDLSYSGSSGQLYFQAFEYMPYLAYNIYILVHTYKINKTYQPFETKCKLFAMGIIKIKQWYPSVAVRGKS